MGESAAHGKDKEILRLRLFVSGATPRSLQSVAVVRKLCETHAPGAYTLDVIDIYQNPELALQNRIVAVPMLLILAPNPKRLFIGDMDNIAPIAADLGFSTFPTARKI